MQILCGRQGLLCEHVYSVEQVFDLMGFEPSHWNKINIHIGGTYGDKAAAMQRFAECAFASPSFPPLPNASSKYGNTASNR